METACECSERSELIALGEEELMSYAMFDDPMSEFQYK